MSPWKWGIVSVVCGLLCATAWARDWAEWNSGELGYRMTLPKEARVVDRDFKNGWYGIVAVSEGSAQVAALALPGKSLTTEELETFVADFAGVSIFPAGPQDTVKDEKAGWDRKRVHREVREDRAVLAVFGQNAHGAYAFVLSASAEDFAKYSSEYESWLDSIRLEKPVGAVT